MARARNRYECRLWHKGQPPMQFCCTTWCEAVAEVKRLLALSNLLGRPTQYGTIATRPRGVIGTGEPVAHGIKPNGVRYRLPIVWRGNSDQFRITFRQVKRAVR